MMIHIRILVLGYEVVTISVELPTPVEQLDAVDDAFDAEVKEHWSALKRWFR